MRDKFAGGPAHDGSRFYQQPLRAGDFILKSFGLAPRFLFQRQQVDVDPQQSLDDVVLERTADVLAFIFLRCQKPMRELSETFLEPKRFHHAFFVKFPALFVGILPCLVPDDALSQLAPGEGEFVRARTQGCFQLVQECAGWPCGTAGFLNGNVDFGEENLGTLGQPGFRAR